MRLLYHTLLFAEIFLGAVDAENFVLHVGTFIENITEGGYNNGGTFPAVQMAVDHINERVDVLSGYTIKLDVKDTKCSDAYAIKALIEQLSTKTTKIALLGPGCSVSTEPVASVAQFWNLLQVSYSASSPRLSDKNRFPNFYRVNAAETTYNLPLLAILKRFGWSKVAIVKQDVGLFNNVNEELQPLLMKNNVTLLTTASFMDNTDHVINDLQRKDARIIIGLMYEEKCRKLMCSAFKMGFHGPHLVWLLRGWYTAHWWRVRDITGCSPQEIKKSLGNYLSIDEFILSTEDIPTISNLTPGQLQKLYIQRLKHTSYEENSYAPYGYDATWVIALALNRSMDILAEANQSLAHFTYHSTNVSLVFKEAISKIKFYGMTGYVKFSETGDRQNKFWVEQMQGDSEVQIGIFDLRGTSKNPNKIDILPNKTFKWPGGQPPKDEMVKTREINWNKIDENLFIFMTTAASFGMLIAAVCLCLNIRNRKHPYIKMSSPHLNNMVIVGCLICYSCVFLYGAETFLDANSEALHTRICQVRLWLLSFGFTLAFGPLFVKTWRVYRIFTNRKLERQLGALYTRHLVLIVTVLMIVDLVFLSVWQSLHPYHSIVKEHSKVEDNTFITDKILECSCDDNEMEWIGCLCAYKGLLLIYGVLLAWETRNVTYAALNDSKYIGMSVYSVVMCMVVVAPLKFVVAQDSVNASYVLIASSINLCSTSTLALVFVPKIRAIRSPPGPASMSTTQEQTTTHHKTHPDCPACKCE